MKEDSSIPIGWSLRFLRSLRSLRSLRWLETPPKRLLTLSEYALGVHADAELMRLRRLRERVPRFDKVCHLIPIMSSLSTPNSSLTCERTYSRLTDWHSAKSTSQVTHYLINFERTSYSSLLVIIYSLSIISIL